MKSKKVAVLITSHNRKEKTLTCIKALYSLILPKNYSLKIYLVDDGSNDGTGKEVKKKYPEVMIIAGNGHLYWNQGMRLAWNTAKETEDYKFYLWLNDDTILYKFAFEELISCYNEFQKNNHRLSIVSGACESFPESSVFTYGGKSGKGPVIPNGNIQECIFINGNVVLISHEIFEILGNLSNDYTHTMGDFDYGLRALKKGIGCCTTRKYVASCPSNEGPPAWCDSKNSLKKRWYMLHSPKGLNVSEYIKFRKKFWGWRWIIFIAKAYTNTLFPRLYEYFSKN